MSQPQVTKPEVPKPKGIQPKRSGVVKRASEEVLAAVKQPLPTGQLEAAPQSFAGIPQPPISKTRERVLVKTLTNPLINPSTGPLPPKFPEDTGPSLPAAPIAKRTTLKHAKKTSDYKPRSQEVSSELQAEIDTKLPPLFKEYQDKQNEIESNNPYLTDTEIYTPQSRKSFYRFISDNYTDTFKLIPQIKGRVDENACAKLGAAAGEAVEAFLYQKFVREYIRNASPYRGVLVYHGLGSGKTCSAIAAAEALYGTANKKIIVMTPYSLQANFMSEISFCGFRHFNVQNHWVAESLVSEGGMAYLYANSVLSLSEQYLNRILRRPEEDRKVIWIPDFTKPINYDELSQQERDDIRAQITEMIKNRIKFISYNGITAAELKRYACEADPVTGERLFDNAVVVIDEVHNLTRLMQGEIQPYIVARKGKKRKIDPEPIVPGKWVPGLCGKPLNYKRPYLFYKLLSDARNTKIIGLSGTPIINFPEELGILANVLSGYMECAEVSLLSTDQAIIKKFKDIAEAEPRVDIVRLKSGKGLMTVLISVFNEGYEKVVDEENVNEFIGVKYNAEAQDDIRTVFARIKTKLLAEKIPIGEETYVSYPRLPLDDETFRDRFINSADLSLQNKVVLQKRLTGLISYYKGSKEEYMPRVIRDEIVKCDMSDYILSKYTVERKKEIEGEIKKKDEGGDSGFAAVEMFAKMKNPSSYRFRSRALCNFAFPKSIDRPFPGSAEEEETEVSQVEDVDTAEISIETEEDLAAQALVAREDALIEAPEEEAVSAVSTTLREGEGAKETAEELEAVVVKATATKQAGGDLLEVEQEDEEDEEEDEYDDEEQEEEENEQNDETEEAENTDDEDEEELTDEEMELSQEGGEGTDDESEKKPEPATASAIKPKRTRPKVATATAVSSVAPVEPSVVQQAKPLRRRPQVATATTVAPDVTALAAAAEEVKEVAAVEEADAKPLVQRVLSYKERIQRALNRLEAESDKFLKLESTVPEARLAQYSTKLDHILRRINNSKGSNLVYSQFKTVEGLGVLGIALKANGFVEIKIEGSDNAPYFSKESEASLRKGPGAKEKRFITFTGGETRDRRALNLNVFNGNLDKLPANMRTVLEESGYADKKNQYGDICWVIGITGAGAEGISLKCCRSVHIMEPYWNNVRLDQVKGRAIRICSHQDLPFKDREVEIYTYYTVFSAEQKNTDKIDMTIRTTDENETSDEKVFNVSLRKDKVNQELLNIMKESAMDCGLNAADNDGVRCFVVDGKPDQYLFDPDLDTDIIQTNIELKEQKEVKEDLTDTRAALAKELGAKATSTKPEDDDVPVMEWKGVSYLMYPKKGSGGLVYSLYALADDRFKKPLGEIAINPATGTFKGSAPVIF